MKYFLILFICFLSFQFISQVDNVTVNQLNLKKEFNYIQFKDVSLISKLNEGFSQAKNKGFSIVHFGDSHIQAEGPTSVARKNLQNQYGDAGRGMMFAYSAANTYSSVLYSTSHTGNWTYAKSFQSAPKLPLGVSGMTVRTDEKNASLIFNLKQTSSVYQKIKVFIKKDSSSFDFKIITNEDNILVKIQDYLTSAMPYIEIPISGNQAKITLQTLQNSPNQNFLEFYGMSLEATNYKGVIYHSVGVGASQFGSLLIEELLDEQLPTLNPNLLIVDFGTNNYLYDNQVKPELGPQIEKIIQNLRQYCPKATILLTSTQDLYYKSKNVTEGITFRNLIDSLAQKNNCLFWDWYAISGGRKSLTKWRDAGFAQTDLVHLTTKGYELKGQLLYEAIKNSLDSLTKDPNLNNINLSYNESKEQFTSENDKKVDKKDQTIVVVKDQKKVDKTTQKKEVPKNTSKSKIHIVKKGDTLYGIASKYKTTVALLKKVNKLKSDKLQIGQKLTIP